MPRLSAFRLNEIRNPQREDCASQARVLSCARLRLLHPSLPPLVVIMRKRRYGPFKTFSCPLSFSFRSTVSPLPFPAVRPVSSSQPSTKSSAMRPSSRWHGYPHKRPKKEKCAVVRGSELEVLRPEAMGYVGSKDRGWRLLAAARPRIFPVFGPIVADLGAF